MVSKPASKPYETPTPKATTVVKEEPKVKKVLSKNTALLKSRKSKLTLNSFTQNNTVEEEATLVEGKANKHIHISELHRAWNQFADKLERNSEKIAAQMLKSNLPSMISEELALIQFSSDAQKDIFNQHRIYLTNYLRKNLENYSLQIEIEVINNTESKNFVTDSQRLKIWQEEYPDFDLLKKTFNLELR
jgi:DNA polymerase-3 subunit gamma/tau